MRQADIPRLRNALEAMRSNPTDYNWRERVHELSTGTEFSSDVCGITLQYERAHKDATALVNHLKRREGDQ